MASSYKEREFGKKERVEYIGSFGKRDAAMPRKGERDYVHESLAVQLSKSGTSPATSPTSSSLLPISTNDHGSRISSLVKFGVLITLTVQNASHVLLTRYSKGILQENYSGTEVVLVGELMKMIVSRYKMFFS